MKTMPMTLHNLLRAVQAWTPDNETSTMIEKIVNEMLAADERDETIAIELGSVLTDGLRYGTWPHN